MSFMKISVLRISSLCVAVLAGVLAGCSGQPEMSAPVKVEREPSQLEQTPVSAERYADIDRHALEAPAELQNAPDQLVAYLIAPARNEAEKARAIFRWITHNIAYDAESYFAGRVPQLSADEALRRGVAVCYGFSDLFKKLAKLAGLQAETLRGQSKGYSYLMKGRTGVISHAWNAVSIDGRWYLLDAAWGAGYLDGQARSFVRRFQPHYFMTPPEEFIFDHFPEQQDWQLLDKPLSETEFNQLAYLRPGFFSAGLKLRSHRQEQIVSRANPLRIDLFVPQDNYISAHVLKGQRQLSDEYLELTREGEIYTLSVHFPEPGDDYRLRIFAKHGSQSRQFNWALDYRVSVP